MTTTGVPIRNSMRHDELCGWNTDTGCFDPADNCLECAVIERVREDEQTKRWEEKRISYLEGQESIRAQFDGEGCQWAMSETCPNGPDCLSCKRLDALTVERYVGWLEGRRDAARDIAVHKPTTVNESITVALGEEQTDALPYYLTELP